MGPNRYLSYFERLILRTDLDKNWKLLDMTEPHINDVNVVPIYAILREISYKMSCPPCMCFSLVGWIICQCYKKWITVECW